MKNYCRRANLFKVKNGLSPIIMNQVFNFQEKESYILRYGIHFGTDTIYSLGPKLWKIIPDKIKYALTLSAFKAKIKY